MTPKIFVWETEQLMLKLTQAGKDQERIRYKEMGSQEPLNMFTLEVLLVMQIEKTE